MKQAFSQIDQFGRNVVFTYRKATKSNSKFGVISTLLFLGYVIWLTYYIGKEIILKQNPTSLYAETAKEDPDSLEVSNGNFVFAMEINDAITYEPFIDERIWTVQAYHIAKTTEYEEDGAVTVDFHYNPIEVEPCTLDHFAELEQSFSVLNLNTHLCLKKNQSLFVSGAFKSETFDLLQFQFKACDNSTSQVTCATPEEIAERVVYISFYHSATAVDLKNHFDPVSRYRDEYFTTVTPSAYREVNYYLNRLTIMTDNGWLTEDIKTENYVQFDRVFDVFSLTQTAGSFAVFNIRPSINTKVYSRSYLKIQNVIAQVNGIVSVSFFALFIILLPYTRIKFYQKLINGLFSVQAEAQKKSDLIQVYRKAKREHTKYKNSKSLKDNQPHSSIQNDGIKTSLKPKSKPEISNDQKKTEIITANEHQLLLTPGQIALNTLLSDQEIAIQFNTPNQDTVLTNNVPLSPLDREDNYLNNNLVSSPASGSFRDRKKENEMMKTEPRISGKPDYKSSFDSARLLNKRSDIVKVANKDLSKDSYNSGFFEDILAEINPYEDPNKHKVNVPVRQTEKMVEDLGQGHKIEGHKSKQISKLYSPSENGNESEVHPQEILIEERGEEEIQEDKEERINIAEAIDAKEEENLAVFEHNRIDITFWEYLKSLISKDPKIQKKMQILNEGIKQIETRLDIFNLLKKLDELDKLKILLLEDYQLALFEGLPPPVLSLSENDDTGKRSPTSVLLTRDPKFVLAERNVDSIIKHYGHLKVKGENRDHVDNKLFNAYANGDDNL